jgi:hypothetical protein
MDMPKTVMRLGTALVAASFACGGAALAQPKFSGAPAAPHISAPAPHVSAPAIPHVSAPAPHIGVAPHIATPHVSAAPRFSVAPRIGAAPHVAAPRFATGGSRNGAHGFTARNFARQTVHGPTAARHAAGRLVGRTGTRSATRNFAGRDLTRHATRATGRLARSTERARARAEAAARTGVGGRVANGRNRLAEPNARRHLTGTQLAALSRPLGEHNRNFADRHRFFHERRRFARGGFIGWFGPVFWPYAYDDFFDYAFWPAEYDGYGFWASAYDDLFDSVFWAPGTEDVYASLDEGRRRGGRRRAHQAYRGATEICRSDDPGLTRWPVEEIAQVVEPTGEQQELLDQLKAASDRAAKLLQTACLARPPATPLGRLDAMARRLEAMLQALETVRPALAKFYDSLTDEQKARFNAMGRQEGEPTAGTDATAKNESRLCGGQPPGAVSDQAIARIEQEVRPNDRQKAELDALREASAKAADELRAACPDQTPITPVARLDAMANHIRAMLDATNTMRPALARFYASLNDEQKAHFNVMTPQQASNQ